MVRHITGIRKSRYISMTGVLVTLLSSLALGYIYSLVLVHEGKSSIPWTTGMLLACIVQAIIGIIVSCAHENSRALQGHSVAMLIYILACLVAPSDYVPKAPVGLTIAYEDVNSDNPFWDQIELMASYASIAGACLSLLVSFIVGTCFSKTK